MFDSPPKLFFQALRSVWENSAIAQTQSQPQPQQPITSPPPSDPLTAWGIAAALILSLGQVVVGIFKEYASKLQRKSEIELKDQESREQTDRHMAQIVLGQQQSYVAHLQELQDANTGLILDLVQKSIEAHLATAQAIKELTEEIRAKK